MKLTPLPGYILVEVTDEQTVRESGFVEPESTKEKPAKGKVIEVSEKAPVKLGQVVVFKRWGGQDITEDQRELKLVKFDEIMGYYG